MTGRTDQIGFSQRVHLEWFEQTANLVLAGNGKAVINAALQELLKDKVSIGGQAERGNREKIITILLKTWMTVPKEFEALRDDGLNLLKRLPRSNHLAIHWGMAMAVYPFWAAVATQTGRLLRLQGTAAAAHVQRRVREQYGERVTVSRAARRVLRSFMDWGVLEETGEKGVYAGGTIFHIDAIPLITWLTEAALHASGRNSVAFDDLLGSPMLFPLRIKQFHAGTLFSDSARIEILRHGLDEALVMLRKPIK